jgi:hypothetical protein
MESSLDTYIGDHGEDDRHNPKGDGHFDIPSQ